ncbi:MAG: GFA family protein, partial [Pseudomonadota bacterium]
CHCAQCRQWSGHYVAATRVPAEQFELMTGAQELTWFTSSHDAERGFCSNCGASMFWRRTGSDSPAMISVMAGCIDAPSGLRIAKHIFVDDKTDYYCIEEGEAAQFGQADNTAAPTG